MINFPWTILNFAPNLTSYPDFVNANILSRIDGKEVHGLFLPMGVMNAPGNNSHW